MSALLARLERPVVFVALLLAVRIVFLLGALDPAQERALGVIEQARPFGSPLPERPLYDREELYTSTAAQAIGADFGLPLAAYRFMPYGSGSLLLSLAAVPLQALCGSSYLAFKILPLLVTLAAGLFWLLTVRRWLGGRAAALFGLLYAFAPAMLVRTGLIAKGDHPEAMALLGVVAWLATRALQAAADRSRRRWAAAAGLLAGLAIYVTYSSAPILAALLLVAAARTRLRPRPAWGAFGLGLGAGLLPWLALVASTSGGALLVYGRAPGSGASLAQAGSRLAEMIATGFMAGYDLPGAALQRLGALLWLACVAAGCAVWLRRRRDALAQALLAALLAHLVSFCLFAPDASSRYLVPCYPLLLIAALGPLLGRAGRRVLAPAGIAALVAIGILSQVWAVGAVGFTALARPLAGADWPLLGEIAGAKLTAPAIRALPEPARSHFWAGYGRRVFHATARENWAEACAAAGEAESRHVWEGIGVAWCETGRLWEAAPLLAALAPQERAALRDGLMRYADYVFAAALASEGEAMIEPALRTFAPEDRPAVGAALARALAVMATQGARIPSAAGAAPGGYGGLDRAIGESGVQAAAGWALYRDASGPRPPRLWRPAAGSWTEEAAARWRGGAGDLSVWRGMAGAYEADLATRPPEWIAGAVGGPVALAGELARLTRAAPAGAEAILHEAAGRAAARALRERRIRSPEAPSADAWAWRTAIAPAHQEDFARGLSAGARHTAP